LARPDGEAQTLERHRLEQRLLQLTTEHPVRLPSQRLVVDPRQQVAAGIANLGPPYPDPACCDCVPEPERAQRGHRVRGDDEAEPRFAKHRRALDHDRLDARVLERDRRREPADPRTNDNRAHASSLRSNNTAPKLPAASAQLTTKVPAVRGALGLGEARPARRGAWPLDDEGSWFLLLLARKR
jgi:hypothetical protein